MKQKAVLPLMLFFGAVYRLDAMIEHKRRADSSEEAKVLVATDEGKGDEKRSLAVQQQTQVREVLDDDAVFGTAKMPRQLLDMMAEYAKNVLKLDVCFPILLDRTWYDIVAAERTHTASVMLPENRMGILGFGYKGPVTLSIVPRSKDAKESRKTVTLFDSSLVCHNALVGITPDNKHLVAAAVDRPDDFPMFVFMEEVQQDSALTYEVGVWDPVTYTKQKSMTQTELQAIAGLEFGGILCVLENGLLALRDKKDTSSIVLYDLITEKTVTRLVGHTGTIEFIQLLDATTIVTITNDSVIRVWDITDTKQPTVTTSVWPQDASGIGLGYQGTHKVLVFDGILYLVSMMIARDVVCKKIGKYSKRIPIAPFSAMNHSFTACCVYGLNQTMVDVLRALSVDQLQETERLLTLLQSPPGKFKSKPLCDEVRSLYNKVPEAVRTALRAADEATEQKKYQAILNYKI